MATYLYKMENCAACQKAANLLNEQGIEYSEVFLDNPFVQMGCSLIFGSLYAPVIMNEDLDVWILDGTGTELLKVKLDNVVTTQSIGHLKV